MIQFKDRYFFKISLVILSLGLSGCNTQVKDFIKVAAQPPIHAPTLTDGAIILKMSPGKMSASATNGAVVGSVTFNNRTFSAGSDMLVNLSINRKRAYFTVPSEN